MNLSQLIDQAANKVGGPSILAGQLGCEPAIVTRAKASGKPPVWLASACAEIMGADVARAELEAHEAAARSDAERAHWRRRLLASGAGALLLPLALSGLLFSSSKADAAGVREHQRAIYIMNYVTQFNSMLALTAVRELSRNFAKENEFRIYEFCWAS
ncbi:hypothetical protein E4T66_20435 [Sinimarinibacterium sp. CAU 1509]|uniref:hypothetical protein n=1 Tax=Sinimarinibacterium sp. CAU 1509 TaxID=2562283 RepID=UPI0010ACBBEF|nr:hypothetical protein [Sinimarinibacterium sp. CAU 1509]TJY55751.1 hypothetical protein E4T66_20435 [Sinimarinibacterium sp. CAU 1509]